MENKNQKTMNESMNEIQLHLYESPRIDVIEMEIEGAILQMSGENGERETW